MIAQRRGDFGTAGRNRQFFGIVDGGNAGAARGDGGGRGRDARLEPVQLATGGQSPRQAAGGALELARQPGDLFTATAVERRAQARQHRYFASRRLPGCLPHIRHGYLASSEMPSSRPPRVSGNMRSSRILRTRWMVGVCSQ